MGLGLFAVAFVGSAVGLWLVSHITEAMRPVPQTPETLRWAPDIPIGYLDVGGCKLRYIRAGRGPNLVLLHTLHTQLDLFEKVVPELARRFTVYALDYPGHGYSDIPEAQYDAEFFAESVAKFLDVLDLHDVTLSGVSIGGAIALILAGRRNPRIARVVAINPGPFSRVASRIARASRPRSSRKCTLLAIGPAITEPSSGCSVSRRAGKKPPYRTKTSACRCSSSGATRIGPGPASASTIAA